MIFLRNLNYPLFLKLLNFLNQHICIGKRDLIVKIQRINQNQKDFESRINKSFDDLRNDLKDIKSDIKLEIKSSNNQIDKQISKIESSIDKV